MNKQLIRWDDLQIVCAIADTGTLSGAGRRLSISHATVFRRLNEMESRLGVALFERSRTGYTPSLAGEELVIVAKRVEADITGAERRLVGRDLKPSGTIRLTTTDTLFTGLLASALSSFRMNYPEIELQVVISNQVHSLSKREADLAIRPTREPPETLIGRRVGMIEQAVYGQGAQWQNLRKPLRKLDNYTWVGPDSHMGDIALEKWMIQKGLNEVCGYRIDSILGMQTAVKSGSGVAVLPCYLGDADERLQRLTDPIQELAVPLWMLTHPDLRRVKRIREFTSIIGDYIRRALEAQNDTVT